MPVIAIAAAAVAVGVAGAGVVAAGLTAVTALEVVAAVGATVSAVGAVTGNKALTYVGAGLGLVGGIGSLAASSGLLGADAASGASLFGPSTAASTADTGAAATAGAATGTSSDVIDSFAGNAGLQTLSDANPLTGADALAGAPAAAGADAASGATAALTPPPGDSTFVALSNNQGLPALPSDNALQGAADQATAAPTTGTPTPTPDINGLSQQVPPSAALTAGANNSGAVSLNGLSPASVADNNLVGNLTPAADQGSSSGVLDSILGFVQKNPLLAFGVTQAGGQFLSGLTSTLTPAQVGALNAQAAANQAAANLTTQQTQNLAQPKTVASLAPVTGRPNNIITPPSAGLINGAPVNITGVPTT